MAAIHSDQTTVDCDDCNAELRTPLPAGTEPVDFAPDGLVEATCTNCGAEVAVGFTRTDA